MSVGEAMLLAFAPKLCYMNGLTVRVCLSAAFSCQTLDHA